MVLGTRNEDALIRELKRKTLVKNRNIMVGRVFLSACLEAMTEQRSKIRRLQEALDAANREAAACKAENDRLNRENLWLTVLPSRRMGKTGKSTLPRTRT